MSVPEFFTRDANRVPITGLGLAASKSITYVEATTGATGATTLFTVTGDVGFRVYATCTTSLTGANATVEVGIAGNTQSLLEQTTATTIDAGHIWITGGPDTVNLLPGIFLVSRGADVIQTIATQAITGGVLTYYCLWFPISTDGSVVAA